MTSVSQASHKVKTCFLRVEIGPSKPKSSPLKSLKPKISPLGSARPQISFEGAFEGLLPS